MAFNSQQRERIRILDFTSLYEHTHVAVSRDYERRIVSSFKQPSSIASRYLIITNRVIIVVRIVLLFKDKDYGVLINFIARTFQERYSSTSTSY